jgi:hypothetical protein
MQIQDGDVGYWFTQQVITLLGDGQYRQSGMTSRVGDLDSAQYGVNGTDVMVSPVDSIVVTFQWNNGPSISGDGFGLASGSAVFTPDT